MAELVENERPVFIRVMNKGLNDSTLQFNMVFTDTAAYFRAARFGGVKMFTRSEQKKMKKDIFERRW